MTNKRMLVAMVVVVGGMVLSGAAQAETIDLSVLKDNWMYGATNRLTYNWGASTDLHAGINGDPMKSIIAFDLSSLEGQYSQITGITLHLYANTIKDGASGLNKTTSVYEISQANGDWVEGTKSGAGAPEVGSSCYAAKASGTDPATPWAGSAGLSTAGVDYVDTLLASQTVTSTGWVALTFTGNATELTALINGWVSGVNAGFLLTDDTEGLLGNDQVLYNSSDAADNTPYLTVEYTGVPEPATMALLGLGGAGMLIRRRRR